MERTRRGGLVGAPAAHGAAAPAVSCCRRRPRGGEPDGAVDAAPWHFMRAPDFHQLAKVREATLRVYRKAITIFVAWYVGLNLRWHSVAQLDALLVEFKNSPQARVTKSQFQGLVAAVELLLPWTKRCLPWSHAVLNGWSISAGIAHTIPEPENIAYILLACWARIGLRRVGAAHLLQRLRGHRPGETLNLRAGDVRRVDPRQAAGAGRAVLHLGTRHGTKAKRPEADIVFASDTLALELIDYLTAGVPPEARLLGGYTYGQYRGHTERFCRQLGLLPYRPHSGRAGRATSDYLSGVPFEQIKGTLRHRNDASLRHYLDVVSLVASMSEGDSVRWHPAADFVRANLWRILGNAFEGWSKLDSLAPQPLPLR